MADLGPAIETAGDGRLALLLSIDVDDFRAFNTEHGDARGDEHLDDLARRLLRLVPGRAYGLAGDDFAVLLEGTARAVWAGAVRVLIALEPVEGQVAPRCSFGAAVGRPGIGAFNLLALAEARLEDQKQRAPLVPERYAELLLTLLRAQRPDTSDHAEDVAALAARVAARLGMGARERALVRRAADLHDVGKLVVDPAILFKPGPLDDDEWREMRRHTITGAELLSAAPALRAVAPLVRSSHERWDGAGYPDGLAGEQIPLEARVVAACDAYDAMTTDRPYRGALPEATARAELVACSGAQFDPAVVDALLAELEECESRPVLAAARAASAEKSEDAAGAGALAAFARLIGMLDDASLVEGPDDLPRALETIGDVIAETLGFSTVVVNLYRRAWDDFIVSTVHGVEELRTQLVGCTYAWEDWEAMLDDRFLQRGAYLVYDGELDWEQHSGKRVVVDLTPSDAPDAWLAEDEIFVPLHGSDGSLLGILNVGSPASGRRPTAADLDILVLVTRHAARAVERAQEAAAAHSHRHCLEQLLEVSSRLTETVSPSGVVEAIGAGISDGLGFGRVIVQLADAATGAFEPAAVAGRDLDDGAWRFSLRADELERLLDPSFESEGCYLLDHEEARRRLPAHAETLPSERNGRGLLAWDRHWLVVPLVDRDGRRLGAVFADEPYSRLLPERDLLQALRLFANQATTALESSVQYETMRDLADRDPLTRLLNRRAFVHRLDAAGRRCAAAGEPLALAYCDLDGFKGINDSRGHAAGDEVLRAFADALARSVRHDDAVFRIGGDEFALVLENCGREAALEVVERALEQTAAAARASFGVAVHLPGERVDSEHLLRRADGAMYAAKGARAVLRVAA